MPRRSDWCIEVSDDGQHWTPFEPDWMWRAPINLSQVWADHMNVEESSSNTPWQVISVTADEIVMYMEWTSGDGKFWKRGHEYRRFRRVA